MIEHRIYKRAEMQTPAYRALAAINVSSLKVIARSPKHYRHQMRAPKAETPAMMLGTAAHTAILEPHRFAQEYACFDGERRAGKAWDAFAEQNAGKVILKRAEFDLAMSMRDAVVRHQLASDSVAGDIESTMIWKDAETGVVCKGRPDVIGWPATIVDVKTTDDVGSWRFGRRAYDMGYHVQLAFYCDGYEMITGTAPRARIVAVEQSAPHDVVVYDIDDDVLAVGRDAYRAMLRTYVECMDSGRWPGVSEDAPMPLKLPAFAMPQEDGIEGLGLEFE